MAQLLSMRKYAAHRGVTLRAVQKAIEAGRITLVLDPVTKKEKIDPAIADAQWVRRTDLEQQLRGNGGVLPQAPAPGGSDGQERGWGDVDDDDAIRDELLRHKTDAARADAQLKTMEALERAGELVSAEDVRRECAERVREVRNGILAVPDRISQVLDPANPERARKLLDTELRKALSDLSRRFEERASTPSGGEGPLQ